MSNLPVTRALGGAFLGLALLAAPASAAEQASHPPAAAKSAESDVPDVPGDDIFGFTSPTDPGKPGDLQYFNENDGRVGKRDGSYGALDSKFALGYTFAENWWIGGAFFSALNHSGDVTGLPNVDRFAFDGLSVELLHRVVERSASNPFAVTLSVEPRWGAVDGETGLPSTSLGSTFKFFTDAVVIPDKLYWGGNVQYTIQNAQNPFDHSQSSPSAQLMTSMALTWQASPSLFLGGEVQYFMLASDWTLAHETGRALYLGPTLLWKASDAVAFNVTFQPQIYGRSASNPGMALDLDDFERALFRAKLVVAF
jgi:hypothetical protein